MSRSELLGLLERGAGEDESVVWELYSMMVRNDIEQFMLVVEDGKYYERVRIKGGEEVLKRLEDDVKPNAGRMDYVLRIYHSLPKLQQRIEYSVLRSARSPYTHAEKKLFRDTCGSNFSYKS